MRAATSWIQALCRVPQRGLSKNAHPLPSRASSIIVRESKPPHLKNESRRVER